MAVSYSLAKALGLVSHPGRKAGVRGFPFYALTLILNKKLSGIYHHNGIVEGVIRALYVKSIRDMKSTILN
jgi:hypothetical protein